MTAYPPRAGSTDHPTEHANRHLAAVARGGAIFLVGTVGSGLLQLALVVAVTNLFPIDVAGAFFTVSSAFLIALAGCSLGADTGLIWAIPRYLSSDRADAARRVVWIALPPVLVASVVMGFLVIVVGPSFLQPFLRLPGSSSADALLVVLAVAIPAATTLDFVLAGTRALGTMTPTVLIDRLGRSVLQLLAVVAVGLLGGGLVQLGAAWAIPYSLACVVGWVAWRRRLRETIGAAASDSGRASTREMDRVLRREFWQFTWPRALGRMLQIALMRIDVVLVAALGGVREAAIYAGASRLLVVGTLGVGAIQQALQPAMSTVTAGQHAQDAVTLYRVATAWNVAASWPAFLLLMAAGPAILRVLGPDYIAGAIPLALLCAAMLFATWAGPVDIVILMAGRSGWSLANAASALTLCVALSFLLVPSFGAIGAAVAWAAATVLRNVLPLLQVRRLLGVRAGGRTTWLVGAAAVLLVGIPVAGAGWATNFSPVLLVGTGALGIAAYLLVLWRLRDSLQLSHFRALVSRRSRRPDGSALEWTERNGPHERREHIDVAP